MERAEMSDRAGRAGAPRLDPRGGGCLCVLMGVLLTAFRPVGGCGEEGER